MKTLRAVLMMAVFNLALSACQSTGGGCPPIVAYSLATMKQAAAELRALPKGAVLERLIADYHRTRDACRSAAR